MFKVDDKVRVVNDKTLWLNNQPEDTVLTVVSEYDDDHEIGQTQVSVNSANNWPEDFELVFSSSMAEPAFKVEHQFIVDGTQVIINKAYIEKEATVRASNQCEGAWRINMTDGFVSGFGLGVVDEEPSERVISKEAHDDMVDANNHVKLNGFPKLGVYRPDLGQRKVDKIRMELFDDGFPNAVLEIAKVMSWAQKAKGYKDHDWVNLPNAENSLKGAASRHRRDANSQKMSGIAAKDRVDHESKLHHLAHQAFNVLAELELILTGKIE